MRGGKGIIDVNIAELGQGLDEGRIVLGLGGVKARIFEHENIALAASPRRRSSRPPPTQSEAKAT